MSHEEHTILAVHSGALGDVVLLGRLLEALAGAVTLVSGGEKGRLLAGLGVVARSLDFDALPMHEVFGETPLRDCRLPALLGPHESLVSCFAGGDRRAELRLAAMCGAEGAAFLPVRPDAEGREHLVSVWFDMMGLAKGEQDAAWPVAPDWTDEAGRVLADIGVAAGGGYVVMHPGAGARDKCWAREWFVAVARKLDRPTVFVVGPVEMDRWGQEAIEAMRREVALVVCPPLATLAGLLAGAGAYVGNDSGVSHLAAAVGAPTLALFGATLPEHFRPRGPCVRTVTGDPMTTISVDRVVSEVREMGDQ